MQRVTQRQQERDGRIQVQRLPNYTFDRTHGMWVCCVHIQKCHLVNC